MPDPPADFTPVSCPALDESVDVDPGADVGEWRLKVPGRAACYLLEGGDGEPILLATVGNLRAALVRRLSEGGDDEPTRRVDYRAVTRRVRWRRVFSRFEGDWAYLENARRLMPRTYRRLVRQWRGHWISVNVGEAHPRFAAADRPRGPAETCFGPLSTAKTARRYIEMIEDLFDLCRYHHILVKAPHGEACAYKEMGRCPAPCDGSITMGAYREQLRDALRFIALPADERRAWANEVEQRMKQAAAELDFERANRLKMWLERGRFADDPAAAHLAPLSRFAFLSFQPGRRKGYQRAFAIGPGTIRLVDEFSPKDAESKRAELLARAPELCAAPTGAEGDAAAERIGLVAWHLLGPKRGAGEFERVPADAPATSVEPQARAG